MILLAIIILAAAAAETTGGMSGGEILGLILGAIFGGGGCIWIGRKGGESAAEKSWQRREEELRTQITNELKAKVDLPQPLGVKLEEKFVSREEFLKYVDDNAHDHDNIFLRLTSNDKSMGEIKGMLSGIRDDLSLIKQKFFRN